MVFMNKIKIIFVTFIFVTSICFASSLSVDENRISEYTLPNGLHFIIMEDHTAPVVSFVVIVNTGSSDEKEAETGISHLIEHLAFNGTEKIGATDWRKEKQLITAMDNLYGEMISITHSSNYSPSGKEEKIRQIQERFDKLKERASLLSEPNEFGKILDRNGAAGLNAYTSNDITVYWVELPSNRTELWAYLESDRLFNPVFRSFYEELDVVKEERRMRTENTPMGKLMEEFHKTAFTIHPYRNPVIGYTEDLECMTRTKVQTFYQKHYVPSNITIVIAGDVNRTNLIPLLNKYFGKIPTGKNPIRDLSVEPPLKETKRITVVMDSEPIFLAAFRIPDINHPDIYPLDICAEIIAGGRTSRLYRRLVQEEKVAVSVACWSRSAKYPSLFYIWAIPSKERTNAEVEKIILEEIENIKTEGITEKELEGAKARLSMDVLTTLKTRRGLAEQLGLYYVLTGNWRNMFMYMEHIESISAKDIQGTVEKYFGIDNMVIGTLEKKGKQGD